MHLKTHTTRRISSTNSHLPILQHFVGGVSNPDFCFTNALVGGFLTRFCFTNALVGGIPRIKKLSELTENLDFQNYITAEGGLRHSPAVTLSMRSRAC